MSSVAGGTVLVTGASGYIGRRLCALLVEKGLSVRAVYRRAEPPAELQALASRGLSLVRADLEDAAGAGRAVEGVAAVIHAAALARDWGTKAQFRKANCEAVFGLLDASEAAGVGEFVFVGSIAVHGFGRHDGSDEGGPYYPLTHPYPQSKLEAERLVLSRNRPGFRTSSLRLGYVYGPGDTTSTYRMFDAASRGAFGYIGPGTNRTSLLYVDHACAALASALGREALAGEAVDIVDDGAVSWRELATAVYESLGLEPRPRRLPLALAWTAAAILSAGASILGSRDGPPLTFYRVRRSTIEYVFRNDKAKALLDFPTAMDYREGFRLSAAAYRARLT